MTDSNATLARYQTPEAGKQAVRDIIIGAANRTIPAYKKYNPLTIEKFILIYMNKDNNIPPTT